MRIRVDSFNGNKCREINIYIAWMSGAAARTGNFNGKWGRNTTNKKE